MSKSRRNYVPLPWHAYLTIDLIAAAARKSIFHPFFAWMMPLSLRAVTVPYEHISFQLAAVYASLLTLYYVLSAFNHKIAFGSSREVDLSEEVIVITGGAGGLGQLIADFYRMRGASVAILDVQEPLEEDESGIEFYKCDVGNGSEIREVAKRIRSELGVPTILINNAAVVNGKSILELTEEQVERNFRVNLMSHFYTVKEFLPGMLEEGKGTIVTVSSVLGYLGVAELSDYTASKAGLLAFHASLRAELAQSTHPSASEVKTILVAPGQLGTPLFAGLVTPSNFTAPVLEPIELAREIVRMVDDGDSGEIRLPFYTKVVPILPALPHSLQLAVRWWSAMDRAMLNFAKAKKE